MNLLFWDNMQFNGVYCIIFYINTHATLHYNNMIMKKKYNLIKILVLYVGFTFNSLLLSRLLWQCILMQSILVEISRLDYLCPHLFFLFWFVINSRPISYLIHRNYFDNCLQLFSFSRIIMKIFLSWSFVSCNDWMQWFYAFIQRCK